MVLDTQSFPLIFHARFLRFMNQRKLISFDWALKRLLRSKANYEVLEG
ncbi:MAG: hypothetical protein BECKG1743D_GA0114223_112371, partial [Candidatus Kentron sp. G]